MRGGPCTEAFPLFDVRVSLGRDGAPTTHTLHVSLSLFLMNGFTEQILRHELAILYEHAAALDAATRDERARDGADALAHALAHALSPEALLAAAPLASVSLSYRDYVVSMQEQLPATRAHQRSIAYWRARLDQLPPPPELPRIPVVAARSSDGRTERSACARAPSEDAGAPPTERFVHRGGRLPAAEWCAVLEMCSAHGVSVTACYSPQPCP